jgi:hypothetical protein
VTALVVLAVVAPPLVLAWEARGGALAAVIAEVVLVGACVAAMRRARPDMHPSLRILPRVALAAALAVAASELVTVPTVPNLGALAIAGTVYFLVLAAVRGIPSELAAALLGRR